jgi:hypothetical protein
MPCGSEWAVVCGFVVGAEWDEWAGMDWEEVGALFDK